MTGTPTGGSVGVRLLRLYAAVAAGVVGVALVMLVATAAMSICTLPGLGCLSVLVLGGMAALVVGVASVVVCARRLAVPWSRIVVVLIGWLVLGAASGLGGLFGLGSLEVVRGSWSLLLVVATALAWPALVTAWWPPTSRGAAVAAGAAAAVMVMVLPVSWWLDERAQVRHAQALLARSPTPPLAAADGSLTCLGPFTPIGAPGADDGYAYTLVEPDGNQWSVVVPSAGQPRIESVRPGTTAAEVAALRARLQPVDPAWLTTCGAPMHRCLAGFR